MAIQKITPCLWFNTEAEEAVNLYTSIFKNSKINTVSRFGKEGFEIHGQPEGLVMTIAFELDGQPFTALNGGPQFKFTEAVSLQVGCDTQDEIDYYWSKLTADGGEESYCGWLKDKFGLSWQIFPSMLSQLLTNKETAGKVTNAFMQMRKFDIEKLKQAAVTD